MPKSEREAALEILQRCRRDKAWSGEAIDSAIRKYGFDRREAALVSRLCLGVIQNEALCDYCIGLYYTGKLEPKVRDVLRLGVYQLLFLDRIPARVAVSESVALCKSSGCARAAGLVNAVLRRVAENGTQIPEIPGKGTADYLSIRYSHPLWLAQYVVDRKGYDFAEAFFAANNTPPKLTAQINSLKVEPEVYLRRLSEQGITYRLCDAPEGCIEIDGGSVSELPGYGEGCFYIQDRAARLTVEIAGLTPGMKVIDACSCPGGKSFAAAIKMKNAGEILASDIHEKKLALVRSGADRLGIDIIRTRAADARSRAEELVGTADAVIADVPCSGLGVIAKKPEIRRRSREEISALPEIQRKILDNLAEYVKPGGLLLYSTCTIMDEENRDVVERFLREHAEFCAEPFQCCGLDAPDGMYSFWPNVDGTDGFFAAKLKRKK